MSECLGFGRGFGRVQWTTIQEAWRFAGQIWRALWSGPYYPRELTRSANRVAYQCVVPVVAILVPTGMIASLMGLKVMALFGTERLLSSLLAQGIIRELAPSLAGIMIASQAGSAIAGEIGTMRVKEEIDALGVMSIDPIKYLVVPRMLALALVCPFICVIATVAGMLGGMGVAVLAKGQNYGVFVANLLNFVSVSDIYSGLLKSVIFGGAVAFIACYYGYHVQGGAVGVGKAANNTVVQSIVAVAILNYCLTTLLMKVLA